MIDFEETDPIQPAPSHRLWAPWRMRYVGGDGGEEGCIFCNRLAASDDVSSLIVHRGDKAFILLNLYPYNTGHVMLVPNEHAASPETADPAGLIEMAELLGPLLSALRSVLRCDGFNIGFNVGTVAGAGVADHLHQHVVPRWLGDANFMPILAETTVMPELIPVTYAKVRAECCRTFSTSPPNQVECSVRSITGDSLLRTSEGGQPKVEAERSIPLWQTAIRFLSQHGIHAELVGWAGSERSDDAGPIVLAFRAVSERSPLPEGWSWSAIPTVAPVV